MAFAASSIWEVQTGGDDTNNGGGFNPGSTNFATDLAASSSSGNTSTPAVTSASYNFASRDVGHWLYIKAGTNWTPGWYKITAAIANAAILDAAVGHCPQYRSGTGGGTPDKLNTVVGCATTASPTGGTWSIDYSQDTTPIAFTDMVIDGTTNTQFTSAAKPVGKNFVGNTISVVSGTGFTVQRVQIVSTSSTVATCDKSLGTLSSTGGTGSMGGPLATPGLVGGLKIANNCVFCRAGTYTISTASTNVTGGCVAESTVGAVGAPNIWEGYQTYRGDKGTRPVFSCGSVSSATLFNVSNSNTVIDNWSLDGNLQTSSRGITNSASRCMVFRCHAANFTNIAFNALQVIANCTATGCTTQPAFLVTSGLALFCEAYDNTITGFSVSTGGTCVACIADTNTGSSSVHGFSLGGFVKLIGCVGYANAGDGFNNNGGSGHWYCNCIAEANTGTGFANTSGDSFGVLQNCAYYNNGTNVATNNRLNLNGILGTGSFFTNAAAGDFSLNNTAGAGAALRAVGFPATFPRGLTANYLDIGAAQHQDAGGGGLALPVSGSIVA